MFTRTRFYTQTLLQTNTFTQSFYTHFYTQTLSHTTTSTLEPCFALKRCRRTNQTRKKKRSFWHSNLISCEKVAAGKTKLAKKHQFLTLEPHFMRKGYRWTNQTRKKTTGFDTRTSFRAKGLSPSLQNHSFTLVFDNRTSFRAKKLPYRGASSAPPACLREKRKRRTETVTESKQAW